MTSLPSLAQLTRLKAISEARYHVNAARWSIRNLGPEKTMRALEDAEQELRYELDRLLREPLEIALEVAGSPGERDGAA